MATAQFFLGVDGGATRCRARLRPFLPPNVARRLVPPRRDAVDGAILLAGGTLGEAEGMR